MIRKSSLSFSDFLGIEQHRLFANLFNLGKLGWLIPTIEGIYDHLDGIFLGSKIQVILYYSRYHFFNCMSCFLRGHYSSAHANLRNAIDTCLHHYNIKNGQYSLEDFVKNAAPHRHAKKIATKWAATESDAEIRTLLSRLFTDHEFASAFGSHADPKSYEYRFQKDDTGQWTFTFLQTLDERDTREECMRIMRAFADVIELHGRMHAEPPTIGGKLLILQTMSLRSELADLAKWVDDNTSSAMRSIS